MECLACGHLYSADEGIFRFVVEESSHGEFSTEEMTELLALAKAEGWKVALEAYARPRRPRAVQMITDPRRPRSVEGLKAVGGSRVLDFGCGYGGVSLALAPMFDEVVSLDGSEGRVSFLNVIRQQENLENVTPVCHIDPKNLPFPDDHFDAVVLIGVLEYLPQSLPDDSPAEAHRKCLREFSRILRPGGHLLIYTKNRFGWQYWLGERDHSGLRFAPLLPVALTDRISRMLKGRPYRIVNYSLRGYHRLLREAGFNEVRREWPVPGYQVPDYMLNLDSDSRLELKKIDPGYYAHGKLLALRALALIGLLKHVVPHYGITAVKPG